MHPDSFSKACVRLAKKAGLEGVHLHSLRHTQASMLIEQGEFPKVISERLGHASTAFTNDIYGHLMPGMEQSAAAKVDAALEILAFLPTIAARHVAKVVKSAANNAENNNMMSQGDLKIVAIHADPGVTLRRFRARSRGRSSRILKRTCHVTVLVEEEEGA